MNIFSGSCERGTFLCVLNNRLQCLPQHLICEHIDVCREDYRAICGLFFGHTDLIEAVTNLSISSNVIGKEADELTCGELC